MDFKRLYSVAFAAALAAAGLLPVASAAADATLSCGSAIATNTTLTQDLTNCPGAGLVLPPDGVTLNLNGHAVSGAGVANTRTHAGHARIRIDGHDHVTVTGGTVSGFDHAILFTRSPYGTVTAVSVHDNRRRGVMFVDASDYATVTHVRAAHNGTPEGGSGVRFMSSSHGL